MSAFSDLAVRHVRESHLVLYLHLSSDGSMLDWNPAAETRLGRSAEELESLRLEDMVATDQADRILPGAERDREGPRLVHFVDVEHRPFTLSCRIRREGESTHIIGEDPPGQLESFGRGLLETNRELAVLNREKTRQSRELAEAKNELQSALEELETSYWHLKKVHEILPVCMHCERVRDEDASWGKLVDYLKKNSIFVSHGLCPECAERHYGEHSAHDEEPMP